MLSKPDTRLNEYETQRGDYQGGSQQGGQSHGYDRREVAPHPPLIYIM